MTTRQEAIKFLKEIERSGANSYQTNRVAMVISYLQAPIPDVELWENRERIGKLLGPWDHDCGVYYRKDLVGRRIAQALTEAEKRADDFDRLSSGYRFVDGPVTVAPKSLEEQREQFHKDVMAATEPGTPIKTSPELFAELTKPKSKGKLGPWKQIAGENSFQRHDEKGQRGLVFFQGGFWYAPNIRTEVRLISCFPTLAEAQAAEDARLLADGWELEDGPVTTKKLGPWTDAYHCGKIWRRENPNNAPFQPKAWQETTHKVPLWYGYYRVLSKGFPTLDEAKAWADKEAIADGWELEGGPVQPLVEEAKERWKERMAKEAAFIAERTEAFGVGADIDDLRSRLEELEKAEERFEALFTITSKQNDRLKKLESVLLTVNDAYPEMKARLLADAGFRKSVQRPVFNAEPWEYFSREFSQNYWFRDCKQMERRAATVVQRENQMWRAFARDTRDFPVETRDFKSEDEAKSWCDEQLRAAGYLLEEGE